METKWYVGPGQPLKATKIADRELALHATSSAWQKITAHLDRARLIQESVDKEKTRRRKMREASKAMTDTWENSFENMRIRKEEARERKTKSTEEERLKNYYALRAEQAQIRQKYVDDAKHRMYATTNYPKEVIAAYVAAEVAYERSKQIELGDMLKRKAHEEETIEAKKIKKGAEDERLERAEKKKKLWLKKMEMKELYLNEIKAHEAARKESKAASIKREREDHAQAKREMEMIEKFREKDREQFKADQANTLQKDLAQKKKKLEFDAQNERECDQVIAIQIAAKDKMACKRKQKEKEILAAATLRNEVASKKLAAQLQQSADAEEALRERQAAELEQIALQQLAAKAEHAKQIRQERIEERKKMVERERERLFKENEVRKWEMVNRYKKAEHQKNYELEKLRNRFEKLLDYRKQLFEQMNENNSNRAKVEAEKKQLAEEDMRKIQEEDKKFFAFAEKILQEARSKGRTAIPIEHVIESYKKNNLLIWPSQEREYCVSIQPAKKKIYNDRPGKMPYDHKSDPNFNNKRKNDLYE